MVLSRNSKVSENLILCGLDIRPITLNFNVVFVVAEIHICLKFYETSAAVHKLGLSC